MGLPLPVKKNYKASAKLKARCAFLDIDITNLNNQQRKTAVRKACKGMPFPEYLAKMDREGKPGSMHYATVLAKVHRDHNIQVREERRILDSEHTERRIQHRLKKKEELTNKLRFRLESKLHNVNKQLAQLEIKKKALNKQATA